MKRHQPILRCLLAVAAVAAVLPGVTLAEIFPFHLFHHRRCCAHPSNCSVCRHDHAAVAEACPKAAEPDCEWVQETHLVQELAERPVERKRVVTVWRDIPETCWVKRPIVQNAYYTTTQMVPEVRVTPIHRVEIRPNTVMVPVATRQDVRPVRVWYPECVPGKVKVDYGHYAYVPCCPPQACCGHHGHRVPFACDDNGCQQNNCAHGGCNTGCQKPCCGDRHHGHHGHHHHAHHHHGHKHADPALAAPAAEQIAAGTVEAGAQAPADHVHEHGHHGHGHHHHHAHHHHHHKQGCCHQPACPQPCCPPPVCGNQLNGWMGTAGTWMGTGTGGGGGGGGWNCGSGGGYSIRPAVLTAPLTPVGCFQWGGPCGPWVRRVWISKICEIDAPVTQYKAFCVPVASEPVSTVKPVTNFRVIPVTDYASETTLRPETYTRSYPITQWQVVPQTKIRSVPLTREVTVREMESYTVEREVKVWVKKPCQKPS
jgi:hypothetical protein